MKTFLQILEKPLLLSSQTDFLADISLCLAIHRNNTKFSRMVVSTDPQREQVLKLIEEKEKIERKLSDLGLVLATVSKTWIKGFLEIVFNFYLF